MAVRFLLGFFESCVQPAMMLLWVHHAVMYEIPLIMAQDLYVVHSRGAVSSQLALVLHVWCTTDGEYFKLLGTYELTTDVGWWSACLWCLSLHRWFHQELAAAVSYPRPCYMCLVVRYRLLPT